MLRDFVLSLTILCCLGLSFRYVYVGVLTWAWIALMQPHREVYGVISNSLRLNLLVAIVTIVAWLFSRERKQPIGDATFTFIALFLGWITFNSFFALDPSTSWPIWNLTWRIFALGLMVGVMATNRVRIHALVWVMVLSLVYYGVRGGLLSILTGGNKTIVGPPDTIIGDNNQLGLTLLMILPLVVYLRKHSANWYIRVALLAVGILTFLSVLGSYSRGAYISLAALCVVAWLRSRNKFVFPITVAVVAIPAIMFMPHGFWDRLNTFNNLDSDGSFQGRVMAWKVAYYVARDHFPLGVGFAAPEKPAVFGAYFPGADTHAAHSIYFQVLGEHGFIGLFFFLVILLLAFRNTQVIRKITRSRPDLAWIRDLATAIQLGLLTYCVGGAALSMAYDDLAVIWFMLLPVLRKLAETKLETPTEPVAMPIPAYSLAQTPGAARTHARIIASESKNWR